MGMYLVYVSDWPTDGVVKTYFRREDLEKTFHQTKDALVVPVEPPRQGGPPDTSIPLPDFHRAPLLLPHPAEAPGRLDRGRREVRDGKSRYCRRDGGGFRILKARQRREEDDSTIEGTQAGGLSARIGFGGLHLDYWKSG